VVLGVGVRDECALLFVKVVNSFKIDRVNVPDDFEGVQP
jgi:hypothetical protein